MAQLTWREMAAPDLSGSLKGYDQFTNLLNSALGGAKNTINDIQAKNDASVNSTVALALAQEQDPAKLKTALLNPGTFAGIDPSRLSAQTIAAIGSRPGQLLAQANQELGLKDATRLSDQAIAADAAAPTLVKMRQAAYSGDTATFKALSDANPDIMKNLNYKTINDFYTGIQGDTKAGVDIQGARDNLIYARNSDARAGDQNKRAWNEDARQQGEFGMRRTEFGWKTDDRNVDQAANAMLASIVESSDPNNKESVRNALFNGPLAFADPRIRALVYSRLPPALAGALGADELAAGIGNVLDVGSGGGDYTTYMHKLENATGNPAAKAVGSSAMGNDQFTTQTWLSTVAAAKPAWAQGLNRNQLLALRADSAKSGQMEQFLRNGNASALKNAGVPTDNANLYAMHHFGAGAGLAFAKASGSTPVSSILSSEAIAANPYLRGMTKNDAINNWNKRAGVSGSGSTPGVQASIALRRGQEAAGRGDATALVQAGSVDSNPNDIVAQLRVPGSRFAGTDAGFVRRELDAIVSQGTVKDRNGNSVQRINYAQAAILLDRHASANTGATSEWLHPSSWNIFNMGNSVRVNKQGDRIDRTALANDIAGLKRNDLVPRANREQSFRTASGNVAANQAAASKAYAELNSLLMRLPTQPGLAAQVQQARAKHAAMLQILEASQAQVNSDNGVAAAAPEAGVGSRANQMWNDIISGGLFSVRRQ